MLMFLVIETSACDAAIRSKVGTLGDRHVAKATPNNQRAGRYAAVRHGPAGPGHLLPHEP